MNYARQEAVYHNSNAETYRRGLQSMLNKLAKEQKVDIKDKTITYDKDGFFLVEEPKKQEKLVK